MATLLIFTTFCANSEEYKLIIFLPENRIWHFMQSVSLGDNLHEMSKPTDSWHQFVVC